MPNSSSRYAENIKGLSFSKVEHVRREVRGCYLKCCIYIMSEWLFNLFQCSRSHH